MASFFRKTSHLHWYLFGHLDTLIEDNFFTLLLVNEEGNLLREVVALLCHLRDTDELWNSFQDGVTDD